MGKRGSIIHCSLLFKQTRIGAKLILKHSVFPNNSELQISNTEVPQSESARGTTPSVWYSANASFQLLASHTVETELGKLIITQFGLFRQK
jgi:hypothetical protein